VGAEGTGGGGDGPRVSGISRRGLGWGGGGGERGGPGGRRNQVPTAVPLVRGRGSVREGQGMESWDESILSSL